MSKSYKHDLSEFQSFKIKKSTPIQKMKVDLRDREARTECSDAKKYVAG